MPSLSPATIAPARRIRGQLRVPGDKSISHRYALLAAVADGTSRIANYAPGADCRSTLACLRGLGVDIHEDSGVITVQGRGFGGWRSPRAPLDAGNSGTTIRMLAGLLAARPFAATLIGDESLSRRPMRRVIEPLTRMGARIDAVDGHPPLTIHGAPLRGIEFRPDVPSAQVKSAVLLAGLQAEGTTRVAEQVQTRDHTERALSAFGFKAKIDGGTISVDGHQQGRAAALSVPGDFSSAAFWLVAAAALPGSRIAISDVGLNPTRIGLVDVLRRYGARVELAVGASSPPPLANDQASYGGLAEALAQAGSSGAAAVATEPSGTIVVEADRTGSVEIGPDEVPALIDELPAIAALAAQDGAVAVRGATELRIKETDRIAALVAGFRGLGISAEELPDGFVVRGSGAPTGGVADARGDHRMAMAFAIAALAARGPSRIEGADAVVVSYPEFFETLARLIEV